VGAARCAGSATGTFPRRQSAPSFAGPLRAAPGPRTFGGGFQKPKTNPLGGARAFIARGAKGRGVSRAGYTCVDRGRSRRSADSTGHIRRNLPGAPRAGRRGGGGPRCPGAGAAPFRVTRSSQPAPRYSWPSSRRWTCRLVIDLARWMGGRSGPLLPLGTLPSLPTLARRSAPPLMAQEREGPLLPTWACVPRSRAAFPEAI